MGWLDYYHLLEKYEGKLAQATKEELKQAARANPNSPGDALDLARKKFFEKHGTHYPNGEGVILK